MSAFLGFCVIVWGGITSCAVYAQGYFGLVVTEKQRDSLLALVKTARSHDVLFDAYVRLSAFHAFRTGAEDSVKAAEYLAEIKKIAYASEDSIKIADYWICEASFLSSYTHNRTPEKDSLRKKLVMDAERLYARILERGELSSQNLDSYMHILTFCSRVFTGLELHEEAYPYIYRSLNMARTRGKIRQEMDASIELGNIHYALMNYEDAVTHYLSAFQIAKKLGSNMEVTLEHNMGLVFVGMEKYEKGIDHLKRAYENLDKRKSEFGTGDYRTGKAIYLRNLVDALLEAERLSEAVHYNRLLSAWADSLNDPFHGILSQVFEVVLLLKDNRLNAALEKEKQILALPAHHQATNYKLNYAFAEYYKKIGNQKERIQRLQAIDLSKLKKKGLFKVHRELAEAFEAIGAVDSAYFHLKKFTILRENINKAVQNRRTYELAFSFEVDKINEQLKQADSEIVSFKSRLQRQYLLTAAAILVLAVVVFLAYGFWRGRTRLARALQKLKEQNMEILRQREEIAAQSLKLSETLKAKNELDAFKESMLNVVVHDLKNPLNTVLGFSEIGDMDESVRTPIRSAGFRMLTLVNTLLDVSKLESAALVPVPKLISAVEWVKSAYEQVRHEAENKQLRFLTDVRPDLWIHADEDLCVRILVNLLTNAIKYTRTGGQITVTVGIHPEIKNRVKISVRDTGDGIAPDFLPQIFDKYSTSAAKSLGVNRSSGLGLYFCKLAVEAHGGKIGATSKQGHGATFFFDLPMGMPEGVELNVPPVANEKPEIMVAEALTEDDKRALSRHVQLLSELEVYETTNILAILDALPSDSETVKAWKKEVRKAVFACNAVRYAMLLRKAEL
jgi:signal transduction histidine kinase